jgi:site-specific DNA-methyltransferase (adenine-specific)
MKEESIDCIFADPPFNLGKDYQNGSSDDLSREEYLNWSYLWIDQCVRLLAKGGALFVYCLPKWAYLLASHVDSELTFRHWIAVSMKSTFKRGRRLYPAHYAILYFTKGEPRVFNNLRIPIPKCRNPNCRKSIKDYGGHKKSLNARGLNLSDFWEDTSPVRHRKYKFRRASELKVMIPERCIRIATRKGDIIFDPFGGGGSTYQAAETLHRFWIGCEIGSCKPIERRLTHSRALPRKRLPEAIRGVFQEIPFRI